MGTTNSLNEGIFRHIHGSNLVYNTCWEDPRCDRELLELNSDSRVVMLTSAGCNALDYLLDDPASVRCVDLNPRQNALLELKCALINKTDHETVFEFFGEGASPRARAVFHDALEKELSDRTADYWRRNLHFFSGEGIRRSFYWYGSSGTVAWLMRKFLQSNPEVRHLARRMFEAETLEQQQILYADLEPRLLNPLVRWFVQQHVVQSMLGVPKSQQLMAASYFSDGMVGYVRHCLRHVFQQLPLSDNYFWRLYFFGKYNKTCRPNYLDERHFDAIRQRTNRIGTFCGSLSDFLKKYPGQYTHFILLDHQDWLAAHLRPALEEEWRLILDNAAPNARVLLRSAAFSNDFLPGFVLDQVRFDRQKAENAHKKDRVGTYASTWIGEIPNR